MKLVKHFLVALTTLLTSPIIAQVGINQASPDASAILDMVSTDKGVLIPRMTAAERDAITVSAAREGLLVYVTDEDVFSFYDGSSWIDLAGGNAGLIDNDGDTKVEVEQSSDEDKIRFTAGGTASGLIDNTDENVTLGEAAGSNITATSGLRNVLMGAGAGDAVTTGDDNTFIGHDAGSAFNTETGNVAVGSNALATETGNTGLTAVGYNALTTSNGGAQNVAVGYRAAEDLTTGDGNVHIGYEAGVLSTTDSHNTFIGNKAGTTANGAVESVIIGSLAGDAVTTGDANVLIGYNTGGAINTGWRAVMIGHSAGAAATGADSDYNVYIGYASGTANNGAYNVMLGGESGEEATGVTQATYLGHEAGRYNQTTDGNTFVGYQAGQGQSGASTGGTNTFVGWNAGVNYTTGSANVAIGDRAGDAITEGTANVFLGASAGTDNTTGNANVYIGLQAGENNTTATDQVAIGYLSGQDNNANRITFLGAWSGNENSSGIDNVYLGYAAGEEFTTASNNVFVGMEAGEGQAGSSTGGNNVGVGMRALESLTTATGNVAIGYLAGDAVTDGIDNILIGSNAGGAVNSGQDNILIGEEAGKSVTDGDYNVMIGDEAGEVSVSDDYNVFIGFDAGDLNNGGNNNTFIGALAGDNVTTGDDNIVLGYNVDAVSATASNQLNIGNTIYGDLSNDQVGIGESDPDFALCVEGTPVGPTYVRVGNDNPTYLHAASPSISFNMYYDGTNNIYGEGSAAEYGGSIWLDEASGTFYISSTSAAGNAGATATSSNKLTIEADGDIGMGTNTPNAELDVRGEGEFTAPSDQATILQLYDSDRGRSMWITAADNTDDNAPFIIETNNEIDFDIDGASTLEIESNKDIIMNSTSNNDMFVLDHSADQIGIDDSSPEGKFHISCGNTLTTGLMLERASSGYDWNWGFGTIDDNLNLYRDDGTITSWVATGDGSWTGFSDRRLKRDIAGIGYGLSEVMAMQPRTYMMIDDEEDIPYIGFIAQELYEVVPEAVHVGGEDFRKNPWGISMPKLIPVLTKAIQEQQVLIEQLNDRIEKLEAEDL